MIIMVIGHLGIGTLHLETRSQDFGKKPSGQQCNEDDNCDDDDDHHHHDDDTDEDGLGDDYHIMHGNH